MSNIIEFPNSQLRPSWYIRHRQRPDFRVGPMTFSEADAKATALNKAAGSSAAYYVTNSTED